MKKIKKVCARRIRMYSSLIACIFLFFISGETLLAQSETLRINEFLASNLTGLTDEDGDFSDWIEIYNPTFSPVNLQGWVLSDTKDVPAKWVFPDVTLQPDGDLVVFASEKNRTIPGNPLHTNFKLSSEGEYLALYNLSGTAVSKFDPAYPQQQTDVSYGYADSSYSAFLETTPGKENSTTTTTLLSTPILNKNRGFYDAPFTLEISSTDQGVKLYYTTDGSIPDATNGKLYETPLTINSTSIIRARSVNDSQTLSKITTQTYLFLDDVIHQTNFPEGYPSSWGPYTDLAGNAIADYEMDPVMMTDPVFANQVKEGLLDLPTMSLITDKNNFFSKDKDPQTGGIYIYTGPPITDTTFGLGYGWERPVSMEYFDAKNSVSFQVDCGVQIQGGHGRRPEKAPKHSLRLVFKSIYGPSKLHYPLYGEDASSDINTIVLRAGFGNSWIHHDNNERSRAKYIEDRWAKDTQMAIGDPSSHGIFVHLYINGIYWGIYNPSERMDNDFAAAYLGGKAEDYDVIKDFVPVVDGNIEAWNAMMTQVNAGLASNEAYQRIRGNNPDGTPNPQIEPMVDVQNLADYILVNFYGGNSDWGENNWVAMRNRMQPGNGFKFFCWDAERILENDLNANVLSLNNADCPTHIFQQLRQNADFRRLFVDRVQKFCFDDGALTPTAASDRFVIRRDQIDKAIEAESARWGDYRRDVHRYQTVGPFDLYTKDAYWIPQMNYMTNTYFPARTNAFVNQLKAANLFPNVDAPVFMINDNRVTQRTITAGDVLTLIARRGIIYYTTDGSDPVIWNSTPILSPSAKVYSQSITLNESGHIKARALYLNEWSATAERFFILNANFQDIKITEIHYHPLDQGTIDNQGFEFIELKNIGTSTLDLGGLQFIKGVEYEFPSETQLKPKGFVVLASNSKDFYERYGFLPFDEFKGQLDNSGEKITLVSAEKDTLCSVTYSDNNEWPQTADGNGYSLVPTEYNPSNDQTQPENWRASYQIGGSPGADDFLTNANSSLSNILILEQNYPNPFSNFTNIRYQLHEEAFVELSVYNLVGQQKIVTLENGRKPAGSYMAEWKGLDLNNAVVQSGIYFYRIAVTSQKGTSVITKKLMLIR